MKNLVLSLLALTILSLAVAPAQTPLPMPGMAVAAVTVKPATTGNPYSPEFYLVDLAAKKPW